MLDQILALSGRDVFYAACMAYVIFYVVRAIPRLLDRTQSHEILSNHADAAEINEQCKIMFPIQKIEFKGKEFTRGMRVKIITMQHKILEGEIIGMNKVNVVCIRTQNQIIAHQLDRIHEMIGIK